MLASGTQYAPRMDYLKISTMLEFQRRFVKERKWARYHTPKNLSMALAGEAAELMEIFQWLTESESKKVMNRPGKAKCVTAELADILYYLLRLSDVLNVDLETAFWEKMGENEKKYPIALSKGNAKKYHELSPVRNRSI
jgi:dCTP diphosphatase